MRVLLQVLLALAFVAAGVLFGAFNPQVVVIDFHVFQATAGLGVSLLVALLFGALLGGIAVTAGIVWPLRRRLRRAERDIARQASPSA
ncbi:MAG TPA: LapA family protein [Xanthomonadaceae bacterium]|jgi:uncharacterized membrane protein YciS (DUF1049 family)